MRFTDDRYSGERSQFELALRMIRHEARTRTIRECTGLSDDRIRKLYTTYFRNSGTSGVKRRRGKSPRQINRFVKNARNQIQATTLVALFSAGLLVRPRDAVSPRPVPDKRWLRAMSGHAATRGVRNSALPPGACCAV